MNARRIAPALGVLLVASTLAFTPTAADAAPSPGVAKKPCGYYVPYLPPPPYSESWYNHCTTDGSHIVIKVTKVFGKAYEQCVGPGPTKLGSYLNILDAVYINKLC
jgi:hypothetical protein